MESSKFLYFVRNKVYVLADTFVYASCFDKTMDGFRS